MSLDIAVAPLSGMLTPPTQAASFGSGQRRFQRATHKATPNGV